MLTIAFCVTIILIIIFLVTFIIGLNESANKSTLVFVFCLILSLAFVATSIGLYL